MDTATFPVVLLLRCCKVFHRAVAGALAATLTLSNAVYAIPLSTGDRIKVVIPEGAEFSGRYEIDTEGQLDFAYLGTVFVAGLEPDQAAARIAQALVRRGFFQANFVKVSVQVLAWAPIEVTVAGAVYQPGRVLINAQQKIEADRSVENDLPGDASPERYLINALSSAGGVMPDADVAHVRVIHDGIEQTYDLSGLFTGAPVQEVSLVAGDQVIVPSTRKFDVALVRPSRITPGTIKVFLSNLTVPARNNSSAAVENNRDVAGFPYGSRFSQAVVAANCVGGTQLTNADRTAVLVHTDRRSGQTKTWQRPIEALIRNSDDENNPLLLPGDGVACYDSTVTNVSDIFGILGNIFYPFSLLFNATRIFGAPR